MGKRKIILILSGIVIILLILVFGIYLRYRFVKQVTAPLAEIQPTTFIEELTTWVDQAEFSFQYPRSLKLNPHDEDQENYAHVELTSEAHPGSLIAWVKDTIADDTEIWVKQEKVQGAIDTTLGGEPAKKILMTDETKKLITAVIYNDYLYQIEVEVASDYWSKVYDTVVSSFKFISSEEQDRSVNDLDQSIGVTDESEIYEEEELIE